MEGLRTSCCCEGLRAVKIMTMTAAMRIAFIDDDGGGGGDDDDEFCDD